MPKKLPPHVTKNKTGTYRVRYKKTEKYPIEFDKSFDNIEDAIRANNEYLAKIALNIYNKNSKNDIGFANFCDQVLDYYRNKAKKTSQNTIRFYKKYMDVLKPYFKNRNLRSITVLDIEKFLSEEMKRPNLSNGTEKGNTISSHTLHHEYAVLRMILNKAVKWGFIEYNPINAVEEPEFTEKEIEVPEYELRYEIETKILTAPIEDRCMYLLGFYTGMREEEVCGVHLEDIDQTNSCVNVDENHAIVQNEKTGEYIEDKVKSKGSVRTIPLPKQFFNEYDKYLIYRKQKIELLKIKTNGEYKEITNVFLNKDGHFFRPHTLSANWRKFRRQEEIAINLTFHGLRHYYLTNQMNYNDELSDRDVQDLAGHANIKTTYKYVHPSKDKIKKNAANIFHQFSKEDLYKNGTDVLTLPIEHVATIILGDPKYSKINELQISLSELSNEEVNLFNISNVMQEVKVNLENNYPMLKRLEKYKYTNISDKEIIERVKREFGKEFEIQKERELSLEM